MARDFHPDRTDPRGLQKNQRALEALLDQLFDSGGAVILSHGDLADLSDDDHPQYVLLAGRAGGQTVKGGTGSGENLTLQSTSHATKGAVLLDSTLEIENTNPKVALDETDAGADSRLWTLAASAGTLFYSARNDADSAGESYMDVVRSGAAITQFRILRNTAVGNLALFGAGSYGGGQKVVFLGNRTTVPGSSPAGGILYYAHPVATGKSNLFAKNEDGKTTRLTGVDARVAADFNKTDATLADVTGLSFNVEAGKTYSFKACVYVNADSTGGQVYAIGGTATATAFISHVRIYHDTDNALVISSQQATLGASIGTTNAPGAGYAEISGTITVNAAGTLILQFSQVTPSGTSTVLRGSTLHLREIT